MYFSLLLAGSNVVFVLVLGSLFLLPGVALATILSISLAVAAQGYVIKRDFDLHFSGTTFIKILFSTAVLAVVFVVLSSFGDSILHLGLTICAGAGAYGLALVLTGAVDKRDITLLRQLLNRS
jgi:O-antigen/teichoic acid export membrane protein